MAPPNGGADDWVFAFLELRNPGSQVILMDNATLQAEVHTRDKAFSAFVDLWRTPHDPQGTWFDPGKGKQLRMRLPSDAKSIVLRTHVRHLTRRESLQVLTTRSRARRLIARLYDLLWVHLPNEPRWETAVLRLDLENSGTLIAGHDDRITNRLSQRRETASVPIERH
jgi:hypothetical protein